MKIADGLVYIGLGSNKGNKIKNIQKALDYLGKEVKIKKISSFYLTEPVGIKGEWFLNCVLEAETRKPPQILLKFLLKIEKEMGRIRRGVKESRVIDLDLLFYKKEIINEKNLIVPHPCLHKRRFVLVPLVEINPHLHHPAFKKTIKEILKDLNDPRQVKKYKKEKNGYN